MILARIANISLAFSGKKLFDNVNFQIDAGDRIGLVGSNGSCKTSLLRIMAGEITPDKGEIFVAKGVKIGYPPQDPYEDLS